MFKTAAKSFALAALMVLALVVVFLFVKFIVKHF